MHGTCTKTKEGINYLFGALLELCWQKKTEVLGENCPSASLLGTNRTWVGIFLTGRKRNMILCNKTYFALGLLASACVSKNANSHTTSLVCTGSHISMLFRIPNMYRTTNSSCRT